MLNNKGFNLWADHYDQTVQVSEENGRYPFAGYKEILNSIFNEVMAKPNSNVLDIGFGTGTLTSKLYENGHHIDGVDFSSKMISIAQSKMPAANLLEWDITNGLPPGINKEKYDFIISTYTLHHLTDDEKIRFISHLLPLLNSEGKICIGDISFESREKLEQCRQDNLNHWDLDEFYLVYDELDSSLGDHCACDFYPISHCGGVFIIRK
ncbi:class I SAM-dependent methyltransferase [Aquisalibacillus elongatus]|uniref:Putative AdoMet-dependent methyltransferase n=1 Tax=Aquisalibacillus elongatus TaxID=485577 RepID=A0A3N5C759_9BACI|nr:class I SAM-dependent methyltransferase [Aquisalibacillus elongatus]RPF55292.1 putative AdoMet-dependent methyltransferase [Aquisalibacillus elongatus]